MRETLIKGGYARIGRICGAGRRSLWMRYCDGGFELRAGREGDDAYVRITKDNPQYIELLDVMSAAYFAAEWEEDDGLTLEREAYNVNKVH